MTKLLLLVAVTIANLAMVAAQTKFCGASYLTNRPDGSAETPYDTPIQCTAATVKTKCIGGYNPRCTLSLRTRQYICCFEVVATVATPDPGSTFPTPSVTVPIRNLKPICPNGALGYGGNQALPCNITNPAAGCPTPTYKCVKAVNVYDFYGTPAVTTDDSGAANTPNVCCHTESLTSYAAVFANIGLSPNIVPTAMTPTSGIVSFYLPTPKVNVYQGDDRSAFVDQLKTMDVPVITLFTKTSNGTNTAVLERYHVLFFDATTNKDSYFVGNLKGSGTEMLKLVAAAPPDGVVPPVGIFGAVVYADAASPLATKPYLHAVAPYTDPKRPGPANTEAHRFVLLVWKTPKALDFGPAATTAADSTRILLGTKTYGDFVPTTDMTSGPGKFTTVTAFLTGKAASILGKPIAGSYYHFMA